MSKSKSESETPSFRELNLAEPLLKALDEIGYETPSPIQAKASAPPEPVSSPDDPLSSAEYDVNWNKGMSAGKQIILAILVASIILVGVWYFFFARP